MKRIVSGILAIAIAVLLIIEPNNIAKAEGVSLALSASSVNVGDSVTATVSCPSGYGVDVVISIDNTSVLSGGNDTVVVIGDAAGQPNSSSVTFSAVGAGTCTISATVRTAGNAEGEPVEFGGGSATVNVNNAVTENPSSDGGADTSSTTDGGTASSTLSSDNTLKSIVLSSGTLSPAFSSKTKNYTATVDNSVTSLAVTATPTNSAAKVTSVSGNENLEVGENTITITVKAENGVTTTYTVVVTRRSETDPENTDAVENKTVYEIGGNSWYTSNEILEEEIPQDFTLSSRLIDNYEYPCLSFDKGNLVLIKMVSADGANSGLFVYDEAQAAIYPFAKLASDEHYVIILMPDASEVPSGYAEVTLAIEGKADVTAYKLIEESGSLSTDSNGIIGLLNFFAPEVVRAAEVNTNDFYLIYCMNDQGEIGWYQYDSKEGSYIRYLAPIVTVEQVQVVDDSLAADVENLKMERVIILSAAGAIVAILLIIILALAIRVVKSKSDILEEIEDEKIAQEYDDEPSEDNEPVKELVIPDVSSFVDGNDLSNDMDEVEQNHDSEKDTNEKKDKKKKKKLGKKNVEESEEDDIEFIDL